MGYLEDMMYVGEQTYIHSSLSCMSSHPQEAEFIINHIIEQKKEKEGEDLGTSFITAF